MSSRTFEIFRHKDASFRICSDKCELLKTEIISLRSELEDYISMHREFKTSLVPLKLFPSAPDIAIRMSQAAHLFNVGPMAAVAGAIAQIAAERVSAAGAAEVIIENGGDSFFISRQEVIIAIFAGKNNISGQLAFRLKPEDMPLGVCSSSSKLGHSLSFGNCDLVTCFAENNSIADAAATSICNKIKNVGDMEKVLNEAITISELRAVFAVKDDKIAVAGNICEIIKINETLLKNKITFDAKSGNAGLITEFYNKLS